MLTWSPADLQTAIESGKPVFLKLWKKGCGACKLSIPALERIVAADQKGIVFGQILSDDFPEILEITETEVLPAFFVFSNKEMKASVTGFKGLEKLQNFIDSALV